MTYSQLASLRTAAATLLASDIPVALRAKLIILRGQMDRAGAGHGQEINARLQQQDAALGAIQERLAAQIREATDKAAEEMRAVRDATNAWRETAAAQTVDADLSFPALQDFHDVPAALMQKVEPLLELIPH